MHKILLISSNNYSLPYPVFPLGLAYVAASLKQHGHQIQIVDRNIAGHDIEEHIKSFVPDFIGVSLRNIDDIRINNTSFFIAEINQLLKSIKSYSNAPVVLGGSAFSLFPERILNDSDADFGITGEGENSFQLFIDAFNSADQYSGFANVPGLVYRMYNKIYKNPHAPLDIKTVLNPFREQDQVGFYNKSCSIINIQTQRGCPFKCCYCTYPLIDGKTVRQRSGESVAEEILQVKQNGARYFFFVDSIFNTSSDHVMSICEAMIKRNIDIPWGCFLRPKNLTSELMIVMKRAGLKHIEFGTDSLSDTTLDTYGKDFTFEDIYHANTLALKSQIHCAHFLITGGPGETEGTLKEGFANSKRLLNTVFFPFIGMRLYPGTVLAVRAVEEKIIEADLDLFSPLFYISPQISKVKIEELLEEFNRHSHNWIVDDTQSDLIDNATRLRAKGVVGPLWEFLAR